MTDTSPGDRTRAHPGWGRRESVATRHSTLLTNRRPAVRHKESKLRRSGGFFSWKRSLVKKRICVIDGQGGGIGATLIRYLKAAYGERVEIVALGTNAIATSQMLKAGANKGASGENAVCRTVAAVDCVIGPVAITWANAMLGEMTPRMAEAVTSSPAVKLLLPLSQENITIVGVADEPLPHLVQSLVGDKIKEVIDHV